MLNTINTDDHPRRALARTLPHLPNRQQHQPGTIATLHTIRHPVRSYSVNGHRP
jgi:hypothetical protein